MPSSSISISPTPDSWTIRTSSRIRSARVRVDVAAEQRRLAASGAARIVCRSVSASSPNIASRTRSSSEAARPSARLAHVLGARRILVERRRVAAEELDRACGRAGSIGAGGVP